MSTPLRHRLPRDFRNNLGKHLGTFLLVAVSISLVSGFLVASTSVERILDGMRDAYAVEDGRFTTDFEAAPEAIESVEALGARVHENFSVDVPLGQAGSVLDATVRVHEVREGFDEAAYLAGRAPEGAGQIALDRAFSEQNGIGIGDSVLVDGEELEVSGLVSLPDYTALFEKNTDFVLNTLSFCVAVVDGPAFERFAETGLSYTYSFLLDDRGMAPDARSDVEAEMAQVLAAHGVALAELVDADANKAISYASTNVDGDQTLWEVLFLLIVVIMAFAFATLAAASIDEESAVIGTLLASGYRKRELVGHYMALPCAVGLAAAFVGNALGYGILAESMKQVYYRSYSLPPYEASWNGDVFLLTTALPFALLMIITFAGLCVKLRCTPLQFLRHETTRAGGRRGVRLPESLGFVARFRLRVFTGNLPRFAALFAGIAFASMLLLFGLCLMPTVDRYADSLRDDLVAEHQYLLKGPFEIDVPGGSAKAPEKYAMAELEADRPRGDGVDVITVYGIQEESSYWTDVDVGEGKVAAGKGFVDKFGLAMGEPVSLSDKFAGAAYELAPTSVWGSSSCMAAYMGIDDFNELFGNEEGYFNGYVSDAPLEVDAGYLAADLTPADMDKIGAQTRASMSDMIRLLVLVAVLVYLVLMYLLTKTVIDRSAHAISCLKVFGYRDREVDRLYLRSITLTVLASLLTSLPLVAVAVASLLNGAVFVEYAGNIVAYTPPDRLALIVLVGAAAYAAVAFFHVRRVRRVPAALALKAME